MQKTLLSTLAIVVLLAGCANATYIPGISRSTSTCSFIAGEALKQNQATRGLVVGSAPVQLEPSGVLALLGGAVGGAVANRLSKKESGLARGLLTAAGAIGGAIAGGHLGKSNGIQFFVEDGSGQTLAVVMQADECAQRIQNGDTVFIVQDVKTGKTRLIK